MASAGRWYRRGTPGPARPSATSGRARCPARAGPRSRAPWRRPTAHRSPPTPPVRRLSGYPVLIAAGATVDPKPRHLFQFAVMGHIYSRHIVGKDNPRVGILSVGEEEGKGNDLAKEAFEELRGSSLNFIANIEGRGIYNGRCDVVVTDGFTGNARLKVSESLAEMLTALIPETSPRDT